MVRESGFHGLLEPLGVGRRRRQGCERDPAFLRSHAGAARDVKPKHGFTFAERIRQTLAKPEGSLLNDASAAATFRTPGGRHLEDV